MTSLSLLQSPLDWLIHLEEEDKISETSLEYLEKIFELTKRSLLAHIKAYKNQRSKSFILSFTRT